MGLWLRLQAKGVSGNVAGVFHGALKGVPMRRIKEGCAV